MEKSPANEKITSGANRTYWTDTIDKTLHLKKLDLNLETDVVVVGGGITGVTTAYCLTRSGKKVVLIEDGNIGSGETGRTSAHLASALDDGYVSIERTFGEEGARLIAQSHKTAIDFVEQTALTEHIDCDFKRVKGYLFLHPSDEKDALDKEMKAAQRAGLTVNKLSHIPGFRNAEETCLEFDDQAEFHPMKYLKALCEIIMEHGGQIYTQTHAKEINSMGIVTDTGFSVSADHVVVATNTPVNNKYTIHLKQYAYRTYMIGCTIKKGLMPHALWWDTGDSSVNSDFPPYHYVRIVDYNETHDIVFCGGEDHPVGLADADEIPEEMRYENIEKWLRQHVDFEEIIYQWSGQIMEPMDSIAFIGRNPHDKENVYIATGDSGNGLTHGTLAALLITDLIKGKPNGWEKIYDPSRFKLFKAGKTFMKEVVGTTVSYLKNKPGNTDSEQISRLPMGEGIVVALDDEKYGIYRDNEGVLHKVSATCTHLKCQVKFNNSEKTWDCPCHGSRFTTEGKVINGPANVNLDYERIRETELEI